MGVDPSKKIGDVDSWRTYITKKLALAIQGAQRTGAKDPLEYIHTYMRMVGIDSANWCPSSDDWSIEFHLEEQDDGQS